MFEVWSFSTYCHLMHHLFVFTPFRLIMGLVNTFLKQIFDTCYGQHSDNVSISRILARSQLRDAYPDISTCFASMQMPCSPTADVRKMILHDDRVTLMSIKGSTAYFVKTKEGVDVYNSKTRSFFFNYHFDFAQDLLTVPLDKLDTIANEEMKKLSKNVRSNASSKKVIVIGSHPRSGGTLLTQFFEDVKGTAIMNEPTVLNDAYTDNQLKRLPSVLFFLCKQLFFSNEGRLADNVVFKLPGSVPALLQTFMEVEKSTDLPFEMHFLFIYRKPLPAIRSWMRVVSHLFEDAQGLGGHLPVLHMLTPPDLLIAHRPFFFPLLFNQFRDLVKDENRWNVNYSWIEESLKTEEPEKKVIKNVNGKSHVVASTSLQTHFLAHWIIPVLILKELRDSGEKVLGVSYEKLVSNPKVWQDSILSFCHLEDSFNHGTQPAALLRDSQGKSGISRKIIAQHPLTFSEEELEMLDGIMVKSELAETLDSFAGI